MNNDHVATNTSGMAIESNRKIFLDRNRWYNKLQNLIYHPILGLCLLSQSIERRAWNSINDDLLLKDIPIHKLPVLSPIQYWPWIKKNQRVDFDK